jgi:hypothetical protein
MIARYFRTEQPLLAVWGKHDPLYPRGG